MRKHCLFQSTIAGAGLRLLVTMALIPIARGEEPQLSISGYDPVAYFTDGKPIKGKAEFEYLWRKLRWRFASSGHRDLFVSSPGQYAPQYDGYCAMGVTNGDAAHEDTVDPEAWAIVDGKPLFDAQPILDGHMAGTLR